MRILLSPTAPTEGEEGQGTTVGPTAEELDVLGGEQAPAEGAAPAEGGEETSAEETPTEGTPTPASTGLSKDDITEILSKVIPQQTATTTAAPAQEQQMTPEEYNKLFNVFTPDAQLVELMRSEDPQVVLKAITALRDGLIRQAMTMAEYRMKQYHDHIREQYVAPLQTYVSEQQATSFRNDFFKANPDLEPYEQIVDAVATKLQAQGFKGESRKAVMERFATESRSVLKQVLAANGSKQASTGTSGAVAPGKSKMSTLTGGGQASGGKRASTKPEGPSGIEVFD